MSQEQYKLELEFEDKEKAEYLADRLLELGAEKEDKPVTELAKKLGNKVY